MTDEPRRWPGPGRRTRRGEPRRSDHAPERLGELVAGFLKEAGIEDDLERQSALSEWSGKVGRKIAEVTRPRSVADSTLVVEVRSSPWLMELNMMKGEILARVNAGRDIPIEKLVFVLSPEG